MNWETKEIKSDSEAAPPEFRFSLLGRQYHFLLRATGGLRVFGN